MKQLLVLLILVLSFVCEGQTTKVDYYEDINYKDIVELKGLLYLKADTILVTGRVIRYNRKNEAKRYILVVNGIPDKSGWINTREYKFIEPKESALGSFVASTWIKPASMAVTGNAINIPYPTNNMYQEYIKENISKAYSDMLDRNEISKKLNSEKEAINGPFEEHYEDGKLEIKGNYIDKKKDLHGACGRST